MHLPTNGYSDICFVSTLVRLQISLLMSSHLIRMGFGQHRLLELRQHGAVRASYCSYKPRHAGRCCPTNPKSSEGLMKYEQKQLVCVEGPCDILFPGRKEQTSHLIKERSQGIEMQREPPSSIPTCSLWLFCFLCEIRSPVAQTSQR